jgi:hypothetical protein
MEGVSGRLQAIIINADGGRSGLGRANRVGDEPMRVER